MYCKNCGAELIVAPEYEMVAVPVQDRGIPVQLCGEDEDILQGEWNYLKGNGTLGEKIGEDCLVYSNRENLLKVQCTEEGDIETYSLLDQKGNIMFSDEEFIALPEYKGEATWICQDDGKYKVVNLEGNRLLAEEFEDMSVFLNGAAAAVNHEGKMGYISDKGETLVDFQYNNPGYYIYYYAFTQDGYARHTKTESCTM